MPFGNLVLSGGPGALRPPISSPVGIYIVQYPGNPGTRRFGDLGREGYKEDRNGYVVTPLSEAALSVQGRHLISSQLTATTILPTMVNRIELAAEGTRGNQLPLTAGEKSALEGAVSIVKTSAPGRTLERIASLAIEQTGQVCSAVLRKLTARDQELKRAESGSATDQRKAIQLQRELINLKLGAIARPG